MNPYVQGAGPIPNDEYGDGHQQVNPQFSQKTNMNIAGQHSTDGNLDGYAQGYGQGQPGMYSNADAGLTNQQLAQFQQQSGNLDATMRQMREMMGDDTAQAILDEVMRIAASQDVSGPMAAPPGLPTPPEFGPGPSSMPKPGNALADPRKMLR